MWYVIPSLDVLLQGLSVVFTNPSYETHVAVVVGWVMSLGRRTGFRVFETLYPDEFVSHNERHSFDCYYNFFNRSAWQIVDLAREVAILIVTQLNQSGTIELIVDDTLLHKWGKCVWGIGRFHDGAASTKNRSVSALGNNWVVMAVVVRVPFADKVFCLPINFRLHLAGKKHPGRSELAREMLDEIRQWFPDRQFELIGDGGYSGGKLLKDLPQQVTYFGLMRGDAALHDPRPPRRRQGKTGPVPKYGKRIHSPREMAKKVDDRKSKKKWKTVRVSAYGRQLRFRVYSYEAVWPRVLGKRKIRVVISHALDAGFKNVYLYTTDLNANPRQIIMTYAKRVVIEQAFKDSKQVMRIENPQHWSRTTIEKLSPWTWLTQSLVTLWYLTDGRKLPAAQEARNNLGAWGTEWSLRHMCKILRRVTIRETIENTSSKKADMRSLAQHLENYLYLSG